MKQSKRERNFNWIGQVELKTDIARKLIAHYYILNPIWTQELDSAIRIILYAANGGLASREKNNRILNTITYLIDNNQLRNSDIIDLAVEILEDDDFVLDACSQKYFSKRDCEIVREFNDTYIKKNQSKYIIAFELI